MNLEHIVRLKNAQESALLETSAKICQLQEYAEDYSALKQLIESLPDSTVHNVMVPFGSLAFMPGHLIHTNEILVLLGDNWFVSRSAKQSAEIVSRRIADVREKIGELDKQKSLLKPRIAFSNELCDIAENKDVFEIKEAYDEEKEKEWKAQHEKNVRKYRKELSERVSGKDNIQRDKDADFQQLWERLDELEKEESKDSSLAATDEDHLPVHQIAPYPPVVSAPAAGPDADLFHNVSKNIRWQDLQHPSVSKTDKDNDDEDGKDEVISSNSDAECQNSVPTITFRHTVSVFESGNSSSEATPMQDVITPGDIHQKICATPKSILKKSTSPLESIASSEYKKSVYDQSAYSRHVTIPAEGDPVSCVVLERKDPVTARGAQQNPSPASADEPKRVSKFKASRLLSNVK